MTTATGRSKTKNGSMKQAHFTLQGKGGVGKSLVASLVVQYLRSKAVPVVAIDADPLHETLSGYKALNAKCIRLMEKGALDQYNYDPLIELIVKEDSSFVVDSGANTFIPLADYLISTKIPELLQDAGCDVVIHTVVAGGQALINTLSGLADLVEQLPVQTKIVVWLNEFFGDVFAEGLEFEEMNVYKKNKSRIFAIVRIPANRDMQPMINDSLTFDEAMESADSGPISKHRLYRAQQDIYRQLGSLVRGEP